MASQQLEYVQKGAQCGRFWALIFLELIQLHRPKLIPSQCGASVSKSHFTRPHPLKITLLPVMATLGQIISKLQHQTCNIILNQWGFLHRNLVWTPNFPWPFTPLLSSFLKSRTDTALDFLFPREFKQDHAKRQELSRSNFHGIGNGFSILTELDQAEQFHFVMTTFQSHIDQKSTGTHAEKCERLAFRFNCRYLSAI